jgi:hypothetical protein
MTTGLTFTKVPTQILTGVPNTDFPTQIRRTEYINHYSFHIIDAVWGHVTIKMSGHPPFGAQIILNGHEYVARQAEAAG